MRPVDVNLSNEKIVRKNIYGDYNENINFKFKIGDHVRISKFKRMFEKGYTANWTEETFMIHERLPRLPPVYRIKDLADEIKEGVFYEKELQKIQPFKKEQKIYKDKNRKKDESSKTVVEDKKNNWSEIESTREPRLRKQNRVYYKI